MDGRPIFFREHSLNILIDQLPVLSDRQSHIVVNRGHDEFVAEGSLLCKLT